MAKMNREMAKSSHHDVIVSMNLPAICIFNKFLSFSRHFALMRSFWRANVNFRLISSRSVDYETPLLSGYLGEYIYSSARLDACDGCSSHVLPLGQIQ